jgi:hypothetical protein
VRVRASTSVLVWKEDRAAQGRSRRAAARRLPLRRLDVDVAAIDTLDECAG